MTPLLIPLNGAESFSELSSGARRYVPNSTYKCRNQDTQRTGFQEFRICDLIQATLFSAKNVEQVSVDVSLKTAHRDFLCRRLVTVGRRQRIWTIAYLMLIFLISS